MSFNFRPLYFEYDLPFEMTIKPQVKLLKFFPFCDVIIPLITLPLIVRSPLSSLAL